MKNNLFYLKVSFNLLLKPIKSLPLSWEIFILLKLSDIKK